MGMSIEEFYRQICGDYAAVSARLPRAELIERFIGRFLEDESFDTLCRHMAAGNRREAFMAAHTLKGISANLGFSGLFDSVSRLTEKLRPESDSIPESAAEMLDDVMRDYRLTAEAIRSYLGK